MTAADDALAGTFDDARADRLRRAAEEAAWLIERGYETVRASDFVCEHHALDDADKNILGSSARMHRQYKHHIARELDPEDVARRPLIVDVEHVLAVVAAAVSGTTMLQSPAGLWCDPAWSRGADLAVDDALFDRVGRAIGSLRPKKVTFVVPEVWSASEAFAAAATARAKVWKVKTSDVATVASPVDALKGRGFVATGDPAVLDTCRSWLNLATVTLAAETPSVLRLHDA